MNDVGMTMPPIDYDEVAPTVEVRPIAAWPGYFIGRDGSGWRQGDDGRLVRMHIYHRRNGCAEISVVRGGEKIGVISVARAVLTAFVCLPPDGHVARHWPDPDHTNNCVDNLRWGAPGFYRAQAARFQAEADENKANDDRRVRSASTPPPPPRFIGPLADLLENDWRRRRRLMRSQWTVEYYRDMQARAGYEASGREWRGPSPWDVTEGAVRCHEAQSVVS